VKVALIGVGRMGGAIAERLRGAGHQLRSYDVRPGAGDSSSVVEAAGGAAVILFSLPDGAAVEAAAGELREPALLVDLTSSHPQITRRVAARLARRGIEMLDAPLSGGVAGAREGRLTAMVGGPPALLERARPVLSAFASNIVWAGELGAGDTVKALNNALSAVALTVSSDMLVRAVAAGEEAPAIVERFNGGRARSQNSEVKFVRDVLPGSYSAGFSAGLMEKDIQTALDVAAGHALKAPTVSAVHAAWRRFVAAAGAEADFTRIHAWLQGLQRPRLESAKGEAVVWNVCLAAGREMLAVAAAEGLERKRTLDIVNASTGRTEATRAGLQGDLEEVDGWPWSI
jgi:3-hydroxyisobutyrate dehydrogenase